MLVRKLLSPLLLISIVTSANLHARNYSPGKDPAIINEARISYWLKKRSLKAGKADTPVELKKEMNRYRGKARIEVLPVELVKAMDSAYKRQQNKLKGVDQVAQKQATKTVKVLAVLIDFPDLPFDNNRLSANDSDMYYSSYPVSHYQNMMFATNGYTGPGGENLNTVYQYYQQETNNEFFFTGNTFGWVTASNNSDYYGANDPDNNDDDIRASELIQEAVEKAVAENNIDLTEYDLEDPYDIDGDGNVNEADGFIDHVNVFHSSIGEEAGGGVLGDTAIWSHRFFVNWTGNLSTSGYQIPGTSTKVLGYTIQPIDAAIGVVAHEFGHDLGLRDEYDVTNTGDGSPVGIWSIMSGGSWAGGLAGSEPTTFSPYARDYLSQRHGVAFANQQIVDIESLSPTATNFDLVDAISHNAINQLKVMIPGPDVTLGAPFEGGYQYHSGAGDNLANSMSQMVTVPNGTAVSLIMRARFDIEQDWDFAQVMINGSAIAGNLTTATNPYTGQYAGYENAQNYISGQSANLAGADSNGWVELTFDLAAYKGQQVELGFNYSTDTNTGGFGFAVDQIEIIADGARSWNDDAETDGTMTFDGFSRTTDSYQGIKRFYYVQLRSHRQNDAGLASRGYERGVLLWLGDDNYSDNKVSEHPGDGFIGVVDADQVTIGTASTSTQIRDAVFSLYDQGTYQADTHLDANSIFSDGDDYSAPSMPAAGRKIPNLGLTMQVLNQATDSSTATIQLTKVDPTLAASFSSSVDLRTVSLTNNSRSNGVATTYLWDFGDGATSTEFEPQHEYAADGSYTIRLTVTDDQQKTDSHTTQITVDTAPVSAFSFSQNGSAITTTNSSSGGMGSLGYSWDFGDGTTSNESSPSHSYASDGTYTITLTVTDAESRTAESSKTVTVATAPPPSTDNGSSSGGGGSLSWFGLLLIGVFFGRLK